MGFILLVGLKTSKKVVGYSHYVYATVASVGMSCQVSHDWNSQHSQLGMIDDCFFFLQLQA